ncbi:MAG: DUF192 domain-containing protein, partial [Nanoarchaeota archaeon]
QIHFHVLVNLYIFAALFVSYNDGIVNNFNSFSPYNEASESGDLNTLETSESVVSQSKLRIIDGLSSPAAPNIKAEVSIEIADTPEKSQKGLGDRDFLAPEEGMLFVLRTPKPTFWMKGMRFPLDFIWIKDGIVTDIQKNIPIVAGNISLDDTRRTPSQDSSHMLEVNANFSTQRNIQVGDRIEILE